jgi:hypothetical protein
MATQANIVHCAPETKHFLTVETREGGVVRSVLANLDGSPVQSDGVRYAGDDPAHVAVYLDTISGQHVVKVSAAAAAKIRNDGGKVMNGCGGVGGLFIVAPDFTLAGRHGEKAKDQKRQPEEPAEYGGPKPGTEKPNDKPIDKAQHNEPPKVAKFVAPAKQQSTRRR